MNTSRLKNKRHGDAMENQVSGETDPRLFPRIYM
jgi:hypothetical protein